MNSVEALVVDGMDYRHRCVQVVVGVVLDPVVGEFEDGHHQVVVVLVEKILAVGEKRKEKLQSS